MSLWVTALVLLSQRFQTYFYACNPCNPGKKVTSKIDFLKKKSFLFFLKFSIITIFFYGLHGLHFKKSVSRPTLATVSGVTHKLIFMGYTWVTWVTLWVTFY